MDIQHTRGPWAYEISEYATDSFVIADGLCVIAEVSRWQGQSRELEQEAEANAILIAMAPTIVAQLEDLAELVEAYLAHGDVSDDAFVNEINETAKLLRKVWRSRDESIAR